MAIFYKKNCLYKYERYKEIKNKPQKVKLPQEEL